MSATPDIVPDSCLVNSDILLGWHPMMASGDPEDRERILSGLITPKEMALQLAFGIFRHALAVDSSEPYEELFARETTKASDGIKGFMTHESCYVAAIALWYERDAVLNYPLGFAGYASYNDGNTRKLSFTDPENLCTELYRNIDSEYIRDVEAGYKSHRDVDIAEALDLVADLRAAGDESSALEIISVYKLDIK